MDEMSFTIENMSELVKLLEELDEFSVDHTEGFILQDKYGNKARYIREDLVDEI